MNNLFEFENLTELSNNDLLIIEGGCACDFWEGVGWVLGKLFKTNHDMGMPFVA